MTMPSWSCKKCGYTFNLQDYKDDAESLSNDMKDHIEIHCPFLERDGK